MFDEPLDPGLVSRHEVREPLVGHVELIVEVVQLAKVVRKTVDVFFRGLILLVTLPLACIICYLLEHRIGFQLFLDGHV